VPLTNSFEGPFATDPANVRVETVTSTRPRRIRLDELLANLPKGASVQEIVSVLRDKKAIGGGDAPLGDRKTLDALIATHSVVMDTTSKSLWVSEGPHLAGRYIRFDLAELLDPAFNPELEDTLNIDTLPEDDIMKNGRYNSWVRNGSSHKGEQ
jgi:hypothetical protein